MVLQWGFTIYNPAATYEHAQFQIALPKECAIRKLWQSNSLPSAFHAAMYADL